MNEQMRKRVACWAVFLLAPTPAQAQSATPEDSTVPLENGSGYRQPAPAAGDGRRAVGRRQIVELALRNSPQLDAARSESGSRNQAVLSEEGRFQIVFQADAGYTESTTPRLQPNDVVASNLSRSFVVGAQLSRSFAFGTTGVLRVQAERFENSFSGGFINPILNQASGFGSTARLTLTQPLLRGLGATVGEVELRAARSARTQAEKAQRRMASQLVRDVLLAYWELWYASEAVRIEREALDLAVAREQDAQARVGRGALAPADALTFATRVAELEESLVTARTNESSRALELLRLTGSAEEIPKSEEWAADSPPDELPTINQNDLQRAVLLDSVELAELEAQVQTARVRAEVAGDELRPRLDVDGFIETRGLGAEPASALSRASEFGWVAGHVGLTFELPMDSSRKNAARQSALLAVSTARANLRAARDRVESEAAQAWLAMKAAEQKLVLARTTRAIAQKAHEAARGRFELGLSITLQVQEAQENVRRAQLREARARVDVAAQATVLKHLSGALLGEFGT